MANLEINKGTQIGNTGCSLEDLVNRFKTIPIDAIINGSSLTVYSDLNYNGRQTFIISISLYGDNIERNLLFFVFWGNQWGTGAVQLADWSYTSNSSNITISYVKSDRGPSFTITNNSGKTISGKLKIICFDKI